MRFAMLVAALGAACLSMPAQAAHSYQFSYSASLTGTQTVYDPNAPFCGTGGPPEACLVQVPYADVLTGQFGFSSEDGTGYFQQGSGCANCTTKSGTVVGGFVNGIQAFSGVNFLYTVGNPTIRGSIYASAPTFTVRLLTIDGVDVPGPIPEPATWAMLILGFGAIGATVRRQQVRVSFA